MQTKVQSLGCPTEEYLCRVTIRVVKVSKDNKSLNNNQLISSNLYLPVLTSSTKQVNPFTLTEVI